MAVINFASTIASLPLATRTLTGLVLAFSLFLFLLRVFRTDEPLHFITFTRNDSAIAFPWLVIVPGVSFWYPWTLITSAFCETSFIEFIITIVSLPLAGRYLERIWGAKELIRFTLVVVVGSNVIAWFIATALFVVLRSETAFYGIQYHGMEALQTGFLVALAQLIPDTPIPLLGSKLPSMRVRDLPMLYVTFSNVTCLLGYTSPFILIQFGWLLGWAYLRFYRYNLDTATRGDRSEAFSFVSWFPPLLHTPVTYISNFLHGIFLKLKIIPKFEYGYVGASDLEYGVSGGLDSNGGPVSARAEAERRRAMALKALDQRMATNNAAGAGSRPNGVPSTSTSGRPSTAPTTASPLAQQHTAPPPEVVFQAPSDEGEERATTSKPATAGATVVPATKSATAVSEPLAAASSSTKPAPPAEEDEAEWPSSDEEGGDLGSAKEKKPSDLEATMAKGGAA